MRAKIESKEEILQKLKDLSWQPGPEDYIRVLKVEKDYDPFSGQRTFTDEQESYHAITIQDLQKVYEKEKPLERHGHSGVIYIIPFQTGSRIAIGE